MITDRQPKLNQWFWSTRNENNIEDVLGDKFILFEKIDEGFVKRPKIEIMPVN